MKSNKFLLALSLLVLPIIAMAANIYQEDKTAFLVIAKDPAFTIQLKSNPTTGYQWFLQSYDSNLVTVVKHQFQRNIDKKLIGAPGYETWDFVLKSNAFVVPQRSMIQFVYGRGWELGGKVLEFQISTD